jgi:hypothetical protein
MKLSAKQKQIYNQMLGRGLAGRWSTEDIATILYPKAEGRPEYWRQAVSAHMRVLIRKTQFAPLQVRRGSKLGRGHVATYQLDYPPRKVDPKKSLFFSGEAGQASSRRRIAPCGVGAKTRKGKARGMPCNGTSGRRLRSAGGGSKGL